MRFAAPLLIFPTDLTYKIARILVRSPDMTRLLKRPLILLVCAVLLHMPGPFVDPGSPVHASPAIIRGDANDDGVITLADAIYVSRYLFARGPAPIPEVDSGDARCDGRLNILDAVFLLNYVLRGGPAPKCPTR